ncbi:bifunctional adenosylcobinamide kinase/adenosylcobinamide-phosphate guanylyltransferase [Eubacteriaceae bacterium ES3]|nr:bifunctional adenosylcobinamide kinase/adenosylcobinamide-phosphate guanylyltransferase [Eubacteriaceae bacterium ES3]
MGKLIFVTGGARSGKSTFAEETAKAFNKEVAYIATAIAFDDGMKDRIKKHQAQRPSEWQTIEAYKDFEKLNNDSAFTEAQVLLFDCLTVMVTNNMLDQQVDYDNCTMETVGQIEDLIKQEVEKLLEVCQDKTLVLVSNEVGMGLVPAYKLGSYFRDIAGRMNQLVAARADEVYFCVSGIPMKIK